MKKKKQFHQRNKRIDLDKWQKLKLNMNLCILRELLYNCLLALLFEKQQFLLLANTLRSLLYESSTNYDEELWEQCQMRLFVWVKAGARRHICH